MNLFLDLLKNNWVTYECKNGLKVHQIRAKKQINLHLSECDTKNYMLAKSEKNALMKTNTSVCI